MSPTDYIVGVLLFAALLAGTSAGAYLLLARRYPHLRGMVRAVAVTLLATLGVLAVHVVPLALGICHRGTVLAATALWLIATSRVPHVGGTREPRPEEARESTPLLWGLAATALGAIALLALVIVRDRLGIAPGPPLSIDNMNFHMPGVAAWLQTGSLWQIDVFLSDVAPGHYPNNGDMLMLATVLPWRSDFLTPLVMLPFWALTGGAVYALVAELRAPRATAAMAAAVVMAIPAVATPVLAGGLVDALMIGTFVTGLLFLLRHHRNGRTSELVLAGLALGVAFGTKWYAVSAVPIVVVVWAIARYVARRRVGECMRQTVVASGLVVAGGGIWLLRNLVESANPVFPVKVAVLGQTLFDAPVDRVRSRAGYTIYDYLAQPDVWRECILPQFRDSLATPAALALAGALVALVLVAARRREAVAAAGTGPAVAGLVITGLLLLAYVKTPYSAGGPRNMPTLVGADARYAVPALILATALTAWVAGALRNGPVVLAVLGLLAVIEGLNQLGQALSLQLSAGKLAVAVGVVALLGAAAAAVGPALAAAEPRQRLLASALLVAVVLAGTAGAGRGMEKTFLAHRYLGQDGVADALGTVAGRGHSVGLAGVWTDDGLAPPLLAFGPRFRNHVAYVGRDDQDVLRRFHSSADFRQALRRGGYDVLVVGRGRPPKPSVNEERWAREAGFRVAVRSPRLLLMTRSPG